MANLTAQQRFSFDLKLESLWDTSRRVLDILVGNALEDRLEAQLEENLAENDPDPDEESLTELRLEIADALEEELDDDACRIARELAEG